MSILCLQIDLFGRHVDRLAMFDNQAQFLDALPNATHPSEAHVTERRAAFFRNGRNQAVRIPRELEMDGSEVLIRKEGDTLTLTPIRKHTLRDLLASWAPLEDALPEVEDLPAQPLR
jgi:antitoxin VapB